ncbi:hypothetical protein BGZ76_009213, partial [Entomortierella beljakovae]
LAGMPRRIPDYPDSFEAQDEDTLANDPWAVPAFFTSPRGAGVTKTATTLEWAITSPPAFHAFE